MKDYIGKWQTYTEEEQRWLNKCKIPEHLHGRDDDLKRMLIETKLKTRTQCLKNIESINESCSIGGESFSKWVKSYNACKEFLITGGKFSEKDWNPYNYEAEA